MFVKDTIDIIKTQLPYLKSETMARGESAKMAINRLKLVSNPLSVSRFLIGRISIPNRNSVLSTVEWKYFLNVLIERFDDIVNQAITDGLSPIVTRMPF
jgi:hypothetical protein